MDLDLNSLLKMARRWWWILLLFPLLGGASAWAASERQTPMYSASALIRINPPSGTITDNSSLQVTQNLGATYRLLVVTDPVLDRVVSTLNLPEDTEQLGDHVTASAVADTQLVRISVTSADPQQAALIADTVAREFTVYVREETVALIDTSLSGLNVQIDDLTAQIAILDRQIVQLDTEANASNPAVQNQLEALSVERTRLQEQVANLELQTQSISGGLASAQTQVTVAEMARVPTVPYEPRTTQNVAIGIFLGLVIAAGVIALLEYLDNTIKTVTDVQKIADVPVLATVNILPDLKPGGQQVFVVSKPRSPSAESIRLLRANLEFAAAGHDVKSLAISSASPGEGKSTIAANLAVTIAQTGLEVLLIDADLRKPTQHRIFSVENELGLSTLLVRPDYPIEDIAVRVAAPHLSLIPSGPTPPNPADLLSLAGLDRLLARLEAAYDFVLIDTPPVRAVSDPILLGRHTDGMVLIARVDATKRETFHQAAEALTQSGIRLLGVVLNQAHDAEGAGYYYYYQAKEPARGEK